VNSARSLSLEHHYPRNPTNNWFVRVKKHLVTRLSTRKHEFESGTVYVRFAIDIVEMGHVSSHGLSGLSCSVISSNYLFKIKSFHTDGL